MKAVILLSAGIDAATGNPAPVPAELSAIRLALYIGAEVIGLHAGPDADAVRPALGHGLASIRHLDMPAEADQVPALAAMISQMAPDIVLAGNRAVGGGNTGILPYRLAHSLGWPILADAVHLTVDSDGTPIVEQGLPKGLRRRLRQPGPLLLTVHRAAPPPMPYAFGRARRGTVETIAVDPAPDESLWPDGTLRPHRPRARIRRGAVRGGSAAERLRAATQSSGGGGELLIDPTPEAAAKAILTHLRRIGVIPASRS